MADAPEGGGGFGGGGFGGGDDRGTCHNKFIKTQPYKLPFSVDGLFNGQGVPSRIVSKVK